MAPVAALPPCRPSRAAPRARTARALPSLRARFAAVRDWCDVNARAFGHNLRRTQARSFRRGPLALPGPLASVSLSADLGGGGDDPSPREEVGRATWTLLHTIAAQFPDKPTKRQQQDVKALFDVLTRIYPCGECAAHFSTLVRRLPPDVSSGESLRQSLCRMHNEVNARLHKPVFNCRFVDARWRALPCAEDEAAEHGGGCALLS